MVSIEVACTGGAARSAVQCARGGGSGLVRRLARVQEDILKERATPAMSLKSVSMQSGRSLENTFTPGPGNCRCLGSKRPKSHQKRRGAKLPFFLLGFGARMGRCDPQKSSIPGSGGRCF